MKKRGVFFFFLTKKTVEKKEKMSGFNNSSGSIGLPGRLPTNDYGRAGYTSNNPTTSVEILPNMNKQAVMKGGERLPQFVNESPQSVEVLISSQNRVSGTRFNFTVDIGATIFRPRLVTVDSVLVPKLYNITAKNNQIIMRAVYVTTAGNLSNSGTPSPTLQFNILPGFYTPETFINAFSEAFTAAMTRVIDNDLWRGWNITSFPWYLYRLVGATPKLTPTFDEITNSFNLKSDPADLLSFQVTSDPSTPSFTNTFNSSLAFYFEEGCNFIQRGHNFIPFQYPSPPPALSPGFIMPITSRIGLQSGTSAMLYTRFCTLSSKALHRFSFAESRVSRVGDGGGRGKIITVIDTSYYQIVEGFGGSILPAEYPNASVINVNNAQGQLEQYLDFVVRDEYGDSLDDTLTNPYDKFGITFWLHVFF